MNLIEKFNQFLIDLGMRLQLIDNKNRSGKRQEILEKQNKTNKKLKNKKKRIKNMNLNITANQTHLNAQKLKNYLL